MTKTSERHSPRWRFSLTHQFAATTLVAVALAATFGPRWDADERWIIGAWFLGALGLAAISRARGQRGIISALLGGGLLPGTTAFAMPVLGGGPGGPAERVVAVTVIVAACGALLGVLTLLLYEQLQAIWRLGVLYALAAFLIRWRPPPLWTGMPIGIAFALAWLATSATWHPRVTIEFYGSSEAAPNLPVASVKVNASDRSNDAVPDIALTTGGTLLAACGYEPGYRDGSLVSGQMRGGSRPRLELWETSWPWPRHAGSRSLPRYPEDCDFSPDGQRLAITHSDAVALWDAQTGEELQAIYPPAQPLAIPPTHTWLLGARFTSDGSVLLVQGWQHPSNDGRLYIWDARSPELLRELAFAGFRSLHLNHRGDRFARVGIPTAWMPTDTLELVDSQSHEVLRRFYHVEPREQPIFSPDDKLLAQGHRLWNLEAGTERIIPGLIKQFAKDGRRVVVVGLAPHRDGLRPWLKAARWLPIVRHWTPDPLVMRSRLLLYDSGSGKLIVASPPQEMIETVTVSRNGRVVATATRKGQIRIWDVPE